MIVSALSDLQATLAKYTTTDEEMSTVVSIAYTNDCCNLDLIWM